MAGWYVDGVAGLTMTVYGAEPSIKTIKLSGDEAAGQTELSVDTDVTGDIWAAGDVANWQNRTLGRQVRVEHWANAYDGGLAAGRNGSSLLAQT